MKETLGREYVSRVTINSLSKQFFTDEEKKKLLHYSPATTLPLLAESTTTFPISHIFPQYKAVLSHIHYTWFFFILRKLSQLEQQLLMSILPKETSTKLQASLSCDPGELNLSPLMQEFASTYLMKELLQGISYLPIETLPKHPLYRLLELSSKELENLIITLGLHDLAIDMRKQIRSSILKALQQSLSSKEMNYVRKLQDRQENLQLTSLHLDKWDGKKATLERLIFTCGINRLTKALYPCHHLLLWNISHRLDRSCHSTIYSLYTDIKNKRIKEKLIHDILELLLRTT